MADGCCVGDSRVADERLLSCRVRPVWTHRQRISLAGQIGRLVVLNPKVKRSGDIIEQDSPSCCFRRGDFSQLHWSDLAASFHEYIIYAVVAHIW